MAGTYDVQVGDEVLECSLRGRVKQGGGTNVAVGDEVRIERLEDGSCRIREMLPRRGTLSRLGVARRREQVIAANIDQVAAVTSVARPDPDLVMLDRLLVLAELNRLAAFIVLNKTDLLPAGDAGLPPDLEDFRTAGYEIVPTSAREGGGLEVLRDRLEGRTTVLTGPSGTGKSSLLNALVPGLDLRIGRVGERKGRGRHTTVAAALYPFSGSGYVADTPGLQYLALWDAEPRALGDAFPELRERADGCRFADCRHRSEPGCAVQEAVERGKFAQRRYRSYLSLLEEAEERR